MALVNFTLSEDGVSAFNDALVCIHKFSDDVSLEIKKDKVGSSLRDSHGGCPWARNIPGLLTRNLNRAAGPYRAQPHKVCLRILHIRRQQILLTLSFRGQYTVSREVLLLNIHQGPSVPALPSYE